MGQNDNIEKFFNRRFAEADSNEAWATPEEDTWDNILEVLDQETDRDKGVSYFGWSIGIIGLIIASYLLFSDKMQIERIESIEKKINKIESKSNNNDIKIIGGNDFNSNSNQKSIEETLKVNKSQKFSTNKEMQTKTSKGKTKIKSSSLVQPIGPISKQAVITKKNKRSITNPVRTNSFAIVPPSINEVSSSSRQILSSHGQISGAKQAKKKNDVLNAIPLAQMKIQTKARPKKVYDKANHTIEVNKPSIPIFISLSTRFNQWADVNTGMIDNPLEELLTDENTLSSWSVGMNGSVRLSKKWLGTVGVFYTKRSHQSTYLLQLPYSISNEIMDNEGSLINAFSHSLPTSLGNVDTDVTLARRASSSLSDNELVGIDLSFHNLSETLIVPMNISYFPSGINDGLYLSGGLVNEILLSTAVTGIHTNSHHSEVNGKSVDINYNSKQQNKYNFGVSFGTGYVWKIYRRTSLMLGANYDFALKSNYNFNGYQHKTNNLAITAGIVQQIR